MACNVDVVMVGGESCEPKGSGVLLYIPVRPLHNSLSIAV